MYNEFRSVAEYIRMLFRFNVLFSGFVKRFSILEQYLVTFKIRFHLTTFMIFVKQQLLVTLVNYACRPCVNKHGYSYSLAKNNYAA
jgi:hypothetical protein